MHDPLELVLRRNRPTPPDPSAEAVKRARAAALAIVVLPDEVRGVAAIESEDGPIYLWAAPTEDGRQCWLIQDGAEIRTGRPYGFGSCDDTERSPALVPATMWTIERPSVEIVHVRVHDDSVKRVDVSVSGAPDISLDVVSGHALGTIPKGARVEAIAGRNADGDVVARVALR